MAAESKKTMGVRAQVLQALRACNLDAAAISERWISGAS